MTKTTKQIYLSPNIKVVSFRVENGFQGSRSNMENIQKSTAFNTDDNGENGNEEVGGLFGGPSF